LFKLEQRWESSCSSPLFPAPQVRTLEKGDPNFITWGDKDHDSYSQCLSLIAFCNKLFLCILCPWCWGLVGGPLGATFPRRLGGGGGAGASGDRLSPGRWRGGGRRGGGFAGGRWSSGGWGGGMWGGGLYWLLGSGPGGGVVGGWGWGRSGGGAAFWWGGGSHQSSCLLSSPATPRRRGGGVGGFVGRAAEPAARVVGVSPYVLIDCPHPRPGGAGCWGCSVCW